MSHRRAKRRAQRVKSNRQELLYRMAQAYLWDGALEALDAVGSLIRLIDNPGGQRILAPHIEREIV